jgi:ureidoacrylate peracid hydrolase
VEETTLIYPVRPDQCALLVIDAQEEYFDPDGPAHFPEAVDRLGNVNALIEAFAARRAPVVYIRHAHRSSGVDVGRMGDFAAEDEEDSFIEGTPRVAFHEDLRVPEDPIVVTKTRYDSFQGTDLDGILRTLGVTAVVIAGYMTSFCCDTTARSAHSRDYGTIFVRDAVGGPDLERLDGSPYPSAEVLEDVAAALAAGFAAVLSTDEVVARLDAG